MTSIAILFFANLIGLGIGLISTGALIDLLTVSLGEAAGIRYALVAMSLPYLPSAYFMWRAAHTFQKMQRNKQMSIKL